MCKLEKVGWNIVTDFATFECLEIKSSGSAQIGRHFQRIQWNHIKLLAFGILNSNTYFELIKTEHLLRTLKKAGW